MRWQLAHSVVAGGILLLGVTSADLSPLLLVIWSLPAFVALRFLAHRSPRRADRHASATGANALTSSRLVLVMAVLAWHWASGGLAEPAWLAITLLGVAEATDYLDGRVARAGRAVAGAIADDQSGARFGATFDMEVDAYVTASLALQAVVYHAAPVWLLAAGLWRYGYTIWEAALTARRHRTGRTLPADVEMPEWFRWQAKSICVVSVIALIGLSLPNTAPVVTTLLSAFVVGILSYSFLTSVVLLRLNVDTATSAPIRS